MPRKQYSISRIDGLRVSSRRAIVFLTCEEDSEINAKLVFEGLDTGRDRVVRSRFDYWIDGGTNDKWFHGFNAPDYRDCFVFKWKQKRQHNRFYGFLCNPQPITNPRFQLCVLVSHAFKNEEETDLAELNHVTVLRVDSSVRVVITGEFPDGGNGKWLN